VTERRQHVRLAERHKVRMSIRSLPGGKPATSVNLSGWTEDISVGGLRLTSRKKLPVGADLDLHVELTHPLETFDVAGKVVWCGAHTGGRSVQAGIYISASPRKAFIEWSRMVTRRAGYADPI